MCPDLAFLPPGPKVSWVARPNRAPTLLGHCSDSGRKSTCCTCPGSAVERVANLSRAPKAKKDEGAPLPARPPASPWPASHLLLAAAQARRQAEPPHLCVPSLALRTVSRSPPARAAFMVEAGPAPSPGKSGKVEPGVEEEEEQVGEWRRFPSRPVRGREGRAKGGGRRGKHSPLQPGRLLHPSSTTPVPPDSPRFPILGLSILPARLSSSRKATTCPRCCSFLLNILPRQFVCLF